MTDEIEIKKGLAGVTVDYTAVSKVNPDDGIRYIWGYIGAMLVGLVIVAMFPWFSTGFLKF